MKTSLKDLNEHLFEQLERLNNPDLSKEELDREINRAKAISAVSKSVVSSASIVLRAVELQSEGAVMPEQVPDMLTDKRPLDQLPNRTNGKTAP